LTLTFNFKTVFFILIKTLKLGLNKEF